MRFVVIAALAVAVSGCTYKSDVTGNIPGTDITFKGEAVSTNQFGHYVATTNRQVKCNGHFDPNEANGMMVPIRCDDNTYGVALVKKRPDNSGEGDGVVWNTTTGDIGKVHINVGPPHY